MAACIQFKKKKSIFPFESCAVRHIIYASLRFLNPYRNSVYIKVERFDVLSGWVTPGQPVPCSVARLWQWDGTRGCDQPLAVSGARGRAGASQRAVPAEGEPKTAECSSIWWEENIPNFCGWLSDIITSKLRESDSCSDQLFQAVPELCSCSAEKHKVGLNKWSLSQSQPASAEVQPAV